MGAAFHERDTHVTAKCNVCFEGVNAAGGATEIQHAAAGGIANVRKGTAGAFRKRKGASARRNATSVGEGGGANDERQSREAGGGGRQTAAAKQNDKRQASNSERRRTDGGRRTKEQRGPPKAATTKQQMAGTRRQALSSRRRATRSAMRGRRQARSVAQRRRAPPNRPLRPNGGVVSENGTMGPFCRVNNSRKAEWCATRNTFCLMGDNINFIAKLRPAKNRPHSRHSWHRNTIPMQ